MNQAIDIGHLKSWIGRRQAASDTIAPRLVRGLRATLDEDPGEARPGETAPLCVHWCLAPPAVPTSATGVDGHPARGGFLPPVPLPRRMWAGGELRFRDPLRVGDEVERRSRIESVELKEGRSGRLCFVSVSHEISTARGVAIEERQDIVYRDLEPAGAGASAEAGPARQEPAAMASVAVEASPLLLFRYSALTFNGHRIHYDRTYCVEEEGYPGLIVHGPLQATLLARLADETMGGPPARFAYRGVSPLFDGGAFTVNAAAEGDGLRLWTAGADGRRTMAATAGS